MTTFRNSPIPKLGTEEEQSFEERHPDLQDLTLRQILMHIIDRLDKLEEYINEPDKTTTRDLNK